MLKTQSIIIHQSHSYTEESWKHMFRAPGWLGLFSIRLLIWAQVVTSGLWDPAPHQALHWVWSMLNILSHTATLENNTEVPQKVKIDLPYNPAIALLGIYPEDTNILIRRSTCTPMFRAAMSTIAKLCREPRCPPTNECIKTWCRVLAWLRRLCVCLRVRSCSQGLGHGWSWTSGSLLSRDSASLSPSPLPPLALSLSLI